MPTEHNERKRLILGFFAKKCIEALGVQGEKQLLMKLFQMTEGVISYLDTILSQYSKYIQIKCYRLNEKYTHCAFFWSR